MEVNLSVDMFIVEYTKLSYKFFNQYVIKGLYHSYHSWFHPINDKAGILETGNFFQYANWNTPIIDMDRGTVLSPKGSLAIIQECLKHQKQ